MSFTRNALFLRWDSGTTKRAFKVLRMEYAGGITSKPASYARSVSSGRLLVVRGMVTPRRVMATVLGEDSPSGTSSDGLENIPYGDFDDLAAAHAATDLEALSFEDEVYWEAEWTGDYNPGVDYDPHRGYGSVIVVLEEK